MTWVAAGTIFDGTAAVAHAALRPGDAELVLLVDAGVPAARCRRRRSRCPATLAGGAALVVSTRARRPVSMCCCSACWDASRPRHGDRPARRPGRSWLRPRCRLAVVLDGDVERGVAAAARRRYRSRRRAPRLSSSAAHRGRRASARARARAGRPGRPRATAKAPARRPYLPLPGSSCPVLPDDMAEQRRSSAASRSSGSDRLAREVLDRLNSSTARYGRGRPHGR